MRGIVRIPGHAAVRGRTPHLLAVDEILQFPDLARLRLEDVDSVLTRQIRVVALYRNPGLLRPGAIAALLEPLQASRVGLQGRGPGRLPGLDLLREDVCHQGPAHRRDDELLPGRYRDLVPLLETHRKKEEARVAEAQLESVRQANLEARTWMSKAIRYCFGALYSERAESTTYPILLY